MTHTDRSSELFIYTQAAKLVEEVGELHAELLGRSKRQRKEKERDYDASSLEAELADVVLSTAVLAAILNVDLAAAVQAKIEVINTRARLATTPAGEQQDACGDGTRGPHAHVAEASNCRVGPTTSSV